MISALTLVVRVTDTTETHVDDEALLELVDTLSQQLHTLREVHIRLVPPIHRTEGEVGAVSVCGVGDGAEGAQVVDPEELRLAVGWVEAAEKEVDRVRLSRTERVGELETRPRSGRGGAEGKVVAEGRAASALARADSTTRRGGRRTGSGTGGDSARHTRQS